MPPSPDNSLAAIITENEAEIDVSAKNDFLVCATLPAIGKLGDFAFPADFFRPNFPIFSLSDSGPEKPGPEAGQFKLNFNTWSSTCHCFDARLSSKCFLSLPP